jgi:uncharacterized protein (TIGR02145 family)
MAVNTFLVKSGRYQMIAVDAIDIVAQEHQRQMSGSVSDEQIAKLGFDAGAEYVCVVERTELDGVSYVATRMVSVESKVAEFADMVKLPQGGDIIEFIKWQVGSMLGIDVGPKPTSAAPQTATTPTQQTAVAAPQAVNQAVATTTTPQTSVDGSGVLTDGRDGKKYRTVVIGGVRWMAENLNYQTSKGSWCYENHNPSCNKYGRLYDWNTAKTVCPSGWYLPSRQEWKDLVNTAGDEKMLKSKSGWNDNRNGTDDFGFSALPGGDRHFDGHFGSVGGYGYWWTATESNSGNAYRRGIFNSYDDVNDYDRNKNNGYSVRCVKE